MKYFEKYLDKYCDKYAIGGIFVTYGEYEKKAFKVVLSRIDRDIRKGIKIISLKEEKPRTEKQTVKEKIPKVKKVPSLSQKKKEILIRKVGTTCCYPNCNETTTLDVHHIIPRHEGGTNEESNLVILCPTHHTKADRGAIPRERLKQYSVARMKKTQ